MIERKLLYVERLLPTAFAVQREGNVFTRVCPSIHPSVCPRGGGGYPSQVQLEGGRGYPSQVQPWGGGVSRPGPDGGGALARGRPPQGTPLGPGQDGGTPARGAPTPGSPQARSGWGYPSQGGHPPRVAPVARSGWGVPQPGGHTPPGTPPQPGQDRGGGYPEYPPETGQHMEYLISGSRYASCVHAGGLSCI